MMIRSYLHWSQNASTQDRAEAVGILADVYLNGQLSPEDRQDALAALTLALDDPAAAVRMTLAKTLGGSEFTPRHIVSSLAHDQPDIAYIVLGNSPVLSDAELVDCLALGSERAQIAIAQRPYLSVAVTAAIAEVGAVTAVVAMIENDGAEVAIFSLKRMLQRFGDQGALREVLLARGDLPLEVHMILVAAAADQLSGFALQQGWLNEKRATRLAQETKEIGAIAVLSDAPRDDIADVAIKLREAGQMTPQLLLRSLLSGETRLLTAALADLAGVSAEKASGFVHARGGMGFKALYRKAGLPAGLEPAFEAALSAWHEFGTALGHDGLRLSRRMVERVLTSIAVIDEPEMDKLMALLLRYQAEAAREEARLAVAELMAAAPPVVTLHSDDLGGRLEHALEIEFKAAA
jgi:uncharacterized protein (DUF2336 family)